MGPGERALLALRVTLVILTGIRRGFRQGLDTISLLVLLVLSNRKNHPNSAVYRHVDLAAGESRVAAVKDLVRMLVQADGEGLNNCAYGEPEICLRDGKLYVPRLEEGRCVVIYAELTGVCSPPSLISVEFGSI